MLGCLLRVARNFIFSGDFDTCKAKTVSRDNLCYLKLEGGLGLQILDVLNKAVSLKFDWESFHSDSFLGISFDLDTRWILFIVIKKIFQSLLFVGFNAIFYTFHEGSHWLTRDGNLISFWCIKWLWYHISLLFCMEEIEVNLNSTIFSVIRNSTWHFPSQFVQLFSDLVSDICSIILSIGGTINKLILVWFYFRLSTFADSYDYFHKKWDKFPWAKYIWINIHLQKNLFFFCFWRLTCYRCKIMIVNSKFNKDSNVVGSWGD